MSSSQVQGLLVLLSKTFLSKQEAAHKELKSSYFIIRVKGSLVIVWENSVAQPILRAVHGESLHSSE